MRIPSSILRTRRKEDATTTHRLEARSPRPDWSSPAKMVLSFISGVILAFAHHVYYTQLDNTIPGSIARQQWPVRFGTAFAFFFKACLANATSIAYIQCVWRQCRQKAIRIGAIDVAFAVERNIFLLFRLEFLFKFPLAAGLMILFWCIPLSALITPATLGISSAPDTTFRNTTVDQPSISSIDLDDTRMTYSYSPKIGQMLTMLAATGELAQLKAPGNLQNISYGLRMIVPVISCQVSNDTVRSLTATSAYKKAIPYIADIYESNGEPAPMLDSNNNTLFHEQNLTFVPSGLGSAGKSSNETFGGHIGYHSEMASGDLQRPELWIAIANLPKETNEIDPAAPTIDFGAYTASYYTCAIKNASVSARVTLTDNVQLVKATRIQNVEMEDRDWPNYSGFGQQLLKKLVGTVVYYHNSSGRPSIAWDTGLDQMIFGTAEDFSRIITTWRLFRYGPIEEKVAPQKKNLTTLIEEFSLNSSLSLMSMERYCNRVPVQVTQTLRVNKYAYESKNLLIAYGCSIMACFITIITGGYAFYASNESYDAHFSSISKAVQGSDFATVFTAESSDTIAEKKTIARTRVQLHNDGCHERFRVQWSSESPPGVNGSSGSEKC